MGELMRRFQMIAAQSHKATANGGSILIAEPKIEKLQVTFAPVQSGSGTPSPTNVRTISGWSTIPVSIGNQTKSISLGGTYYGGVVDLVSGTLTVQWGRYELSQNPWNALDMTNHVFNTRPGGGMARKLGSGVNYMCDTYSPVSEIGSIQNMTMYSIACHKTANYSIFVRDDRASTVDGLKALLADRYIVYELATPQTYQLTPQTINALRGMQTVSSSAGSVEITYWTH